MKKNLILGGIFVLALSLTFIFQEKRVEQEAAKQLTQGEVFPKDIDTLTLPKLKARKIEGVWFSFDGKQLSHNLMTQIEKKIQWVRKIKDVQGEWKTYFSDPLEFSVNGKRWTIGDMGLDKKSFYLAEENRIMLAEVTGENLELASGEDELPRIKYDELKGFLQKPESELGETQLFRFYKNITLNRALIESQGRLPFELNFESNTTLPPMLPGIEVFESLKGKFVSLLTQVSIANEIPYPKQPFQKIGSIDFIAEKGKEVRWELWLLSKDSADAAILDPTLKKSWKMIGGTLKVFFVGLQDYWDKKIIPPSQFKKFTELKVRFAEGNKSADVTVFNREPLKFEAIGFKVQTTKMDSLFQLLFNLSLYDQADRVSPLTNTDKKLLSLEQHLEVSVMGQNLMIWKRPEEIIVVNLTQGYKVHFHGLHENLGTHFGDVLK